MSVRPASSFPRSLQKYCTSIQLWTLQLQYRCLPHVSCCPRRLRNSRPWRWVGNTHTVSLPILTDLLRAQKRSHFSWQSQNKVSVLKCLMRRGKMKSQACLSKICPKYIFFPRALCSIFLERLYFDYFLLYLCSGFLNSIKIASRPFVNG